MMEWQPIETAPRDGTEVLVWDRDHDGALVAVWDDEWRAWRRWYTENRDLDELDCATHWMPIPPPPAPTAPEPAPSS